jgi:Ca2+-binding EF-hand superfamily protein/thiol-disulfide isomerase/thioredoxin
MISVTSLLSRQRFFKNDSMIINSSHGAVVALRDGNPYASIRYLKKSAPKSRRLDSSRVFFKSNSNSNSWDAPAHESIDDETATLLDRYETTFHEADTNKDGLLHRAELRELLERVAGGAERTPLQWLNDDDLDSIFNQYDLDGNNAIDLKEFMKLAQDNVFLQKELSEYQTAFQAVDKNGDGYLGPTELLSVLSHVDSPLKSYDNIVRLMNKYDTDRNGRMDFAEFLRLCRYEHALPLDSILSYAAARATARSTSGSKNSEQHKKHHHHKKEAHISPLPTTATAATTSNVLAATSLASEIPTTTTTTSASDSDSDSSTSSPEATPTPKPAGGAAARNAEQRAKMAKLIIPIDSEESFNSIFEQESNKDKLVVVMGSLTWCRPCKRFAPVYQRMAAAYTNVVFLHLNGNDNEDTKQLFKHKLKIRATPSFLFFRKGVVVDSCNGANPSRFESHLRSLLTESEMPRKNLYELIDISEDDGEESKAQVGFEVHSDRKEE